VVGDTCVSESGLAAIVGRDKRYQICGSAHGFSDAGQLIRQHRPDVLLIEPFLENRDGILWIKELAREYSHTRILIVSRQSEQVYAERALHAGAAGYWMKNGSPEELMHAVETVVAGEIYTSPSITALAIRRFARRADLPKGLDALSDRQLAVFSMIAAGRRAGEIAKELGISCKTVTTHFEHIKHKMGYANAEELKHGARELLGSGEVHACAPRNGEMARSRVPLSHGQSKAGVSAAQTLPDSRIRDLPIRKMEPSAR
jgi:DNA-binding NarL/FixJ family response regulator